MSAERIRAAAELRAMANRLEAGLGGAELETEGLREAVEHLRARADELDPPTLLDLVLAGEGSSSRLLAALAGKLWGDEGQLRQLANDLLERFTDSASIALAQRMRDRADELADYCTDSVPDPAHKLDSPDKPNGQKG